MTHRFNPPPGWPAMPVGWTPPVGWIPPADWPLVPEGWQLWIDEPGTALMPSQASAAAAPPTYPAAHPAPATHSVVVVTTPKSPGLAFVLTFLFGPLGMLYSTVAGGLVMMAVFIPTFVLAFLTFGLALLPYWIVCLVWATSAASKTKVTHAAALPYGAAR